jgi:mevalonate kinase
MEKFSSKVLMFGEYSLLYDSMALTIPYDKFSGHFTYPSESKMDGQLSNKGLRQFCDHLLQHHTQEDFKLNVSKFKDELDKGLFFESNIPQGFGLGSSGALVAAIFLRYLHKAADFKDGVKNLTKDKICSLKGHLGGLEGYFHGTSSGIDPLSILMNKPLLLKSNTDIEAVKIPTFNNDGKNVVFLLNTKLSRNTDKLVHKFKAACEESNFKSKLENDLISFTNDSINQFIKAESDKLYQSLNQLVNFQLDEMNYLIPTSYQQLVKSGLDNGLYFLKICGSGGGGYMLGFTENWEETQKKLVNEDLEILYRY